MSALMKPCRTCSRPWSPDAFYESGSECKVCKRARSQRNKRNNSDRGDRRNRGPKVKANLVIMGLPGRFWAKVLIEDTGYTTPCLIWTGARSPKGYGVYTGRSGHFAHRAAYEAQVAPIPKDVKPRLTIDHLCRTRACVNVDHMEVVTDRENIRRSTNHTARALITDTCPQGHAYTPENTRICKRGARNCRTCERERVRTPNPVRTHCKKGHPYTEDNVIFYANGTRKCKTCAQAAEKARLERQRANDPNSESGSAA